MYFKIVSICFLCEIYIFGASVKFKSIMTKIAFSPRVAQWEVQQVWKVSKSLNKPDVLSCSIGTCSKTYRQVIFYTYNVLTFYNRNLFQSGTSIGISLYEILNFDAFMKFTSIKRKLG